MFTGLVQAMGVIEVTEARPSGRLRLVIRPRGWDHLPAPGDSISVSGCCLTVTEPPAAIGGMLAFDLVPETLAKTTLGGLRAGAIVNLERSLAAGDLMGGHIVQGHVDGVGTIEGVQTGGDYRVGIRPPADLMPYLVPKGSVAIDGVSLTVAGVDPGAGTFWVALIPTTLERTTLGQARAGERCNLEADAMAKTVVHYLRYFAGTQPGRGR